MDSNKRIKTTASPCRVKNNQPAESSVAQTPAEITITHEQDKEIPTEEIFVWPWIGILANVTRELKNGKYIGSSGSKDKNMLTEEGLHPVKVKPIWNQNGHSGFSLVHFASSWVGFYHLMKFEKTFAAKRCDKESYQALRNTDDTNLYGWAARAEDFHQTDIVGYTLKKKRNIRTIREIQSEEERNQTTLIAELTNKLNSRDAEIMRKRLQVKEELLQLAQQQQQEIKELHVRLLVFQHVLDTKQELELEMECLKTTIKVTKRLNITEPSLEYEQQINDAANAVTKKQAAYTECTQLHHLLSELLFK